MREIRIVITDTSVSFPDGRELGRIGEHNATQLIIELPDDMVAGVDYHVIKFSLLSGTITSDIITGGNGAPIYLSDGKIYCTLWQQLTASRGMSFTIEAYKIVGGTPTMIKKSPLVSGLRFELSADAGAEVDEQGYSLAVHVNTLDERVTAAEGDISDLQETKVDKVTGKGLSTNDLSDALKSGYDNAVSKKHEHDNKATLDNFSSLEGILPTYQDRIIPQMAVDTDYDEGTIAVYNSVGILKSAENSEEQPLNVSEIVGTIDKAHEHPNKELLDAYDGKTGGVTVVDYYDDLPADAAEGELAYVRLETESGNGAPVDLSECPDGDAVENSAGAEYVTQGGTVGDVGWQDYFDAYTNCDIAENRLKLVAPPYHSDYTGDGRATLTVGHSYNEYIGIVEIGTFGVIPAEGGEVPSIISGDTIGYVYVPGITYKNTDFAEVVVDGITKYEILFGHYYAFEAVSGTLYNTDFDGLVVTLAPGWNALIGIAEMDEYWDMELVSFRSEPVTDDIYLPTIQFWDIQSSDISVARDMLSEMIYDTAQQTVIPKGLHIKTVGGWRWIG